MPGGRKLPKRRRVSDEWDNTGPVQPGGSGQAENQGRTWSEERGGCRPGEEKVAEEQKEGEEVEDEGVVDEDEEGSDEEVEEETAAAEEEDRPTWTALRVQHLMNILGQTSVSDHTLLSQAAELPGASGIPEAGARGCASASVATLALLHRSTQLYSAWISESRYATRCLRGMCLSSSH